ncbi:hypothetical protein NTE_03512 [Candidatus Nitrososphaera evergladensis SR1]|uniref:Uncharacterized protein n=1 Tax=Candidatus Nitrososphaera evergladensis SR1 TaxID=1459636 RepID=A0A075MWB4_9ARCH|nr:hypothetical protein NTE_03512 [Candidatus Nitrososphaera evergladensis SR1]
MNTEDREVRRSTTVKASFLFLVSMDFNSIIKVCLVLDDRSISAKRSILGAFTEPAIGAEPTRFIHEILPIKAVPLKTLSLFYHYLDDFICHGGADRRPQFRRSLSLSARHCPVGAIRTISVLYSQKTPTILSSPIGTASEIDMMFPLRGSTTTLYSVALSISATVMVYTPLPCITS